MNLALSAFVFFVPTPDGIVAWQLKRHEQFLLEPDELMYLSILANSGSWTGSSEMLELFIQSGLIEDKSTWETRKNWDWDALSWIFHFGTSDLEFPNRALNPKDFCQFYLNYCSEIQMSNQEFEVQQPDRAAFPLAQNLSAFELAKILSARRTTRNFQETDPINIDEIEVFLRPIFANQGFESSSQDCDQLATHSHFRSYPSAGGLHGELITVLVPKKEDPDKLDVYSWNFSSNSLVNTEKITNSSELSFALNGQFFFRNANFNIILSCNLSGLMHKYKHSKSLRMCYLDAGHISQNIQLMATASAFDCWITGSFHESSLLNISGISDLRTIPTMFLSVGKSHQNRIPEEFYNAAKIVAK
jgi:SagB-type dehydrogenase family enzyme